MTERHEVREIQVQEVQVREVQVQEVQEAQPQGAGKVKEVLDAVRRGRTRGLPELIAPLDRAERKELLGELKVLRAEVRGWGWKRWRERDRMQPALLIAGAGCHTGAAATAAWLGGRDLRNGPVLSKELLAVLDGRDPAWFGDVAARLAARPSTAEDDYRLIRRLSELAGRPMPLTDGFIRGWLDDLVGHRGDLARLHEDPCAPTLITRLFELPVLPPQTGWHSEPGHPAHWPAVVAGIVSSGAMERSTVLDACVARLLRGGRPNDMRFFLELLRALAPAEDEQHARIPDWVGMAADGIPVVAAEAQSVLTGLSEAGRLPVETLAEMTGAVLFRPEKKLVRAQLALAGKALRKHSREAAAVAQLLPAVAEAFGHEDTGVQERALKLVARHLPTAGDGLREELAGSAARLGPAHRQAAGEVFGALLPQDGTEEYEEILPAVPAPLRLPPAPESVAELVEELVVAVRRRRGGAAFERLLNGLVRLMHREPLPLAAALREAMAGQWWMDSSRPLGQFRADTANGIVLVIASFLRRAAGEEFDPSWGRNASARNCPHGGLGQIVSARLWETARRVHDDPPPFLLATPTWQTGALDADVLVERLREYRRLGVEPGAADFGQALLRVRRDGGDGANASASSAAETAALLGTAEGARLAAWLSDSGPELPALHPGEETGPVEADGTDRAEADGAGVFRPSGGGVGRLLRGARVRLVVHRDFPRAFRWLGKAHEGHCNGWACSQWEQEWALALPHDGEALARWMTFGLKASGSWANGVTACLPTLVEAETEAGVGAEAGAGAEAGLGAGASARPASLALHRALAAGAGARQQDDRLLAVDALLMLAARGRLDTALFGRELARMVQHEGLKLNRLAGAARTAADAGASRTTWRILSAVLPGLLATKPLPRGVGELLGVAADCVERCGPSAPAGADAAATSAPEHERIPGLAELAARGGSSQMVMQAARLTAALGQPAG